MVATIPADKFKNLQAAMMIKSYNTNDTAPLIIDQKPPREQPEWNPDSVSIPAPAAQLDPNHNLRMHDGEYSPSAWLWIGIFFMPLIFAWFTLQKNTNNPHATLLLAGLS